MNQLHLSMLISTLPYLLHFLHPSPLHSFTLNSKLTFLLNPFRHKSSPEHSGLTSSANGTVSVLTLLIGFSSWGWVGRLNQVSSFLAHTKIGNFVIIMTFTNYHSIALPYEAYKLISSQIPFTDFTDWLTVLRISDAQRLLAKPVELLI